MKIDWRGGIGYGDFLTGLAYAHNCKLKYKTDIKFVLHWNHSKNYKPSTQDPETIIERCNYIGSLFPNDISILHKTDSLVPYRYINNLHENNPVHGMYNLNLSSTIYKNVIVTWRSSSNLTPVGKSKDPLTDIEWEYLYDWLRDLGYEIVEVTYRTPIKEVVDICKKCVGGIGYDGMIHQIFKLIQKPVILFCERHKLNKLLLPWAEMHYGIETFDDKSLFEKSANSLEIYQQTYLNFLKEYKDFTTHPLYNIPQN